MDDTNSVSQKYVEAPVDSHSKYLSPVSSTCPKLHILQNEGQTRASQCGHTHWRLEPNIQSFSQSFDDDGVARSEESVVTSKLGKELIVVPGASRHLGNNRRGWEQKRVPTHS